MSILGYYINENLAFFLFGCQDDSNGIFGNVYLDVGGDFHFYPVFLDAHYGSVDSTRSDDFISGFELSDHFLVLFLFGALRPDEQEVEDHKDKDERDHGCEHASLGTRRGLILQRKREKC